MAGRIAHVSIGWALDSDEGPQQTLITLADFQRHCRTERVEDLLDDLQVLCEDVQEARDRQDCRTSSKLRALP